MTNTLRGMHRILITLGVLLLVAAGSAPAQPKSTEKSSEKSTDKTMYTLPWPAEAGWHPEGRQEKEGLVFVEFLKGKETFDNWTEIGSILKLPLKSNDVSLEAAAQSAFEQHRKMCESATMTILDKSDTGAHPWIIYSVICPKYSNGTSESNIYQIIRDNKTIYICQRGFRLPEISDAQKQEVVAFFKGGSFIQEK